MLGAVQDDEYGHERMPRRTPISVFRVLGSSLGTEGRGKRQEARGEAEKGSWTENMKTN